MIITTSKREAAMRQLDVAIELLLNDKDPLAIRTLSSAAFGILSDLVEAVTHKESWREKLISDSGLSKTLAIAVLNNVSNFLKHADRDPFGETAFEEEENDHIIFFATIECGELGTKLTHSMQAFQIWYLACQHNDLRLTKPALEASAALPGLLKLSRKERLQRGSIFLTQVHASHA